MPYCTRFASLHLLQLGEDGDENAGQDSRASTGLCIGLTAGMNSTSPRLAKAVGVIKRPAINREHTSVFTMSAFGQATVVGNRHYGPLPSPLPTYYQGNAEGLRRKKWESRRTPYPSTRGRRRKSLLDKSSKASMNGLPAGTSLRGRTQAGSDPIWAVSAEARPEPTAQPSAHETRIHRNEANRDEVDAQ